MQTSFRGNAWDFGSAITLNGVTATFLTKKQKQSQPLDSVMKCRCSATVLKQLRTSVKEFIFEQICKPIAKNELDMNSFKFIFQVNWPHFKKGYNSGEILLPNGYFCKALTSGCFCILYCLWVRDSKASSFFQ